MSVSNTFKIARAPMAALASVGVFWGGFSALVPDIKATVEASDQAFGLVLLLSAAGSIAATFLVPMFGKAVGNRALPVLGMVIVLAFFYPLLASDVGTLAVALFFVGASVAALDISANVRISSLEASHDRHLMNVSHAMFSVAFGASALAAGLARKAGYGPAEVLPTLAVVALLLSLPMWEGAGRFLRREETEEEKAAFLYTPWPAILLTAVVLFAAFIGENATEAWSALHIERTLGAPAGEGGYGPAVLGLMMTIVRFSGQFVATRFGEARLILWSAVCGTVGAVIIGAAPTKLVALIGVGILGVGMAVIVPSVNSILGRLVSEEQRSHAISRAWMFGMTGFFVGPTVMGLISEYFGLRIAFYTIAILVAAVVPAILSLDRRAKAAGIKRA